MKKNFKGSQRFHRRRDVLVPHALMSGFLLTINPLQEERARREAQDYFNSLTKDLLSATQKFDSAEGDNESPKVSSSTSALLAAELESAVENDKKSRKRNRDDDENVHLSWFSSIDTGCKGYLLLRIPMINQELTCCSVANEALDSDKSSNANGHIITINPLVSILVDRVFTDLKHNPRPVFRHCFRLFPVECTCCPVLQEMTAALKELIQKHFLEPECENTLNTEFTSKINFSRSISNRKSLTTVLFKFSVKNNTKVQQGHHQIQSALVQLFPLNKFTVLNRPSTEIEAAVHVTVVQSTCTMGIQRCYSERSSFNIGEIGRSAFEVESLLKK